MEATPVAEEATKPVAAVKTAPARGTTGVGSIPTPGTPAPGWFIKNKDRRLSSSTAIELSMMELILSQDRGGVIQRSLFVPRGDDIKGALAPITPFMGELNLQIQLMSTNSFVHIPVERICSIIKPTSVRTRGVRILPVRTVEIYNGGKREGHLPFSNPEGEEKKAKKRDEEKFNGPADMATETSQPAMIFADSDNWLPAEMETIVFDVAQELLNRYYAGAIPATGRRVGTYLNSAEEIFSHLAMKLGARISHMDVDARLQTPEFALLWNIYLVTTIGDRLATNPPTDQLVLRELWKQWLTSLAECEKVLAQNVTLRKTVITTTIRLDEIQSLTKAAKMLSELILLSVKPTVNAEIGKVDALSGRWDIAATLKYERRLYGMSAGVRGTRPAMQIDPIEVGDEIFDVMLALDVDPNVQNAGWFRTTKGVGSIAQAVTQLHEFTAQDAVNATHRGTSLIKTLTTGGDDVDRLYRGIIAVCRDEISGRAYERDHVIDIPDFSYDQRHWRLYPLKGSLLKNAGMMQYLQVPMGTAVKVTAQNTGVELKDSVFPDNMLDELGYAVEPTAGEFSGPWYIGE